MINKFKVDKTGRIVHEQTVNSMGEKIKAWNAKQKGNPVIDKDNPPVIDSVNPVVEKVAVSPEREKYLKDSMSQITDIKVKALLNRVECVSETQWQPLVPLSKAQSYFIPSQGYYVAYDNETKQVLCLTTAAKDNGNVALVLRKPTSGGGSGTSVIKHLASPLDSKSYNGFQKDQGSNLSYADMQSMIDGKPSLKEICATYDRYFQDSVDMDTSNAKAVW